MYKLTGLSMFSLLCKNFNAIKEIKVLVFAREFPSDIRNLAGIYKK